MTASNYESAIAQPQDSPTLPTTQPGVAQAAVEGQTTSTLKASTALPVPGDPITNDVFPNVDLKSNDVFQVAGQGATQAPDVFSVSSTATDAWPASGNGGAGGGGDNDDGTTINNAGSGSTTINDNGSGNTTINNSGSGDTTVNDTGSGSETINNSGSGTLTVNASGGPVTVNDTGSGTVVVNENGHSVTVNNSGTGPVTVNAGGGSDWPSPPAPTNNGGGNGGNWGGAPSSNGDGPPALTPGQGPQTADLNSNQKAVLNDITQAGKDQDDAQQYLADAAQRLQAMGISLGNPLANAGGLNADQTQDTINNLGLNQTDNGPNGGVNFLSWYGRLLSHDEQINGGSGDAGNGNIIQQIAADATGSTNNGQSSTFAPDAMQANWLMTAVAWSLDKNSSGQFQIDGGAEKDIGLGLAFSQAAGGSNIMTELNRTAYNASTISSSVADRFAPNPLTPQGMQQLEQTSGWSAQQIAADAVIGHAMINGGQLTAEGMEQFFQNAANMSADPIDAGLLDNLPGGAQWAQQMADSSNPAAAALNEFLSVNAQSIDPGLMAYAVGQNTGEGWGGGNGNGNGNGGGWNPQPAGNDGEGTTVNIGGDGNTTVNIGPRGGGDGTTVNVNGDGTTTVNVGDWNLWSDHALAGMFHHEQVPPEALRTFANLFDYMDTGSGSDTQVA